jgi:hypothetical protein
MEQGTRPRGLRTMELEGTKNDAWPVAQRWHGPEMESTIIVK